MIPDRHIRVIPSARVRQNSKWRPVIVFMKLNWVALVAVLIGLAGGIPGIISIARWVITGVWEYGY